MSDQSKTGDLVTWDAREHRVAILQLLLAARKRKASSGGMSAKMLEDCLQIEQFQVEFALSNLRRKRFVEEIDQMVMITGAGFDHLNEQLAKTSIPETKDWPLAMEVLRLLGNARQKNPSVGGASAKMLVEILRRETLAEVEFVLWYLCEKGMVHLVEHVFKITDLGFEYLKNQTNTTQNFSPS